MNAEFQRLQIVSTGTTAFFVPLPAAEPDGNLPYVVETNDNLNHASSRSRHLGGVNVLSFDGAVDFLSDSVDRDSVWRPLATVDGGKGARFRANDCSVRGDRCSQRTSSIGQTYKTHWTNAQE